MIANLQALRAVAALLVVAHHIRPFVFGHFPPGLVTEMGAAGVDVFFVISGVVMVYANRASNRTSVRFWRERALRILPLYWLVTFLIVALSFAGLRPVGLQGWSWSDLAASLLLVPNVRIDGVPEPILTLGWTLIYEAFFYAVFGAALIARDIGKAVALTVGVLTTLALVGLVLQPEGLAWKTYTSPLLLEFAAGTLLGLVYLRTDLFRRRASASLAVPLLMAAVAAMVLADTTMRAAVFHDARVRVLCVGIPAVVIVAAALALEQSNRRVSSRAWLFLGAASYALYLSHPLVLQTTWKAMAVVLPQGSVAVGAMTSAVAFGMAVAVGALMHVGLERPPCKGAGALHTTGQARDPPTGIRSRSGLQSSRLISPKAPPPRPSRRARGSRSHRSRSSTAGWGC